MKVGLVMLLVAALYWPDTAALLRYWLHQDVKARGGILIAVLCGFLFFRVRERFEQISLAPMPWAGLPLMACAAASLICWRAGILTLQLFFLPPILWLSVLCLFGWPAARAGAFAIGFLYFAIPGWDVLQPSLQHLTAAVVGVVGPPIGLPVVMSGTSAHLLAGVTFTITRACSGAEFLAVGLAIAALHGELEQASLRRRAGLMGGMLLLALVSNWLRVIIILAIGYLSHMRSPLATRDHVALGWVVFAGALLVFIWFAGRTGAAAPDAMVASASDADARASAHLGHPLWRYGVIAAAIIVVPAIMYVSLLENKVRAASTVFELPPGRMPWHGPAGSADGLWQPMFVGAHAQQRALYRSADGRTVEVVAIGFPKQTQGAQILNGENSLLGDHGLVIEAVALVDGAGIPHSEIIAIDPHGRRSLIWSVIDIGGQLFGEPLFSQLWYGARSVVGAPYSALFALRAPCDGSCDRARSVLADFLRANGSALFAALPDAAVGRRQGDGARQEM